MVESILLMLVAPAIAIAIVLLVGFAGCDFIFSLDPPDVVVIDSVTGTSATSLEVAWTFPQNVPSFQIEVTRLPDEELLDLFEAEDSPFEVTGLLEATAYRCRVRPVFSDGEGSFSSPVNGLTLTGTFDTNNDPGVPGDQAAAQGFTVVQRLDQVRLAISGGRVAITVRGPSAGTTLIDRVYISQPAAAGDPYDAAPDLTPVFDINLASGTAPLMAEANTDLRLPPVAYALDETRPLLVAFEITSTIPSTIRFIPVPPGVAQAFFRPGAEASVADRQAGYTAQDRIYLITRIDVEVG